MCFEIIYLVYTYKKDLALNNLPWLICHKTKPNTNKLLTLIWFQVFQSDTNNLHEVMWSQVTYVFTWFTLFSHQKFDERPQFKLRIF